MLRYSLILVLFAPGMIANVLLAFLVALSSFGLLSQDSSPEE
jgi:hypothetical protein